jgi:hypothetical protein
MNFSRFLPNILLLISFSSTLSQPSSCDNTCLIACANGASSCDSIWNIIVPPTFTTGFILESGKSFNVTVNTSLAEPMARRFYILSILSYFSGSPFYRVLRNSTSSFVAQVGYRGVVDVDKAWISQRTSNETVAVVSPGNIRGSIAFGTSEVPGPRTNCSASFCSLGFSVELFINTANNSRLDDADFSPFGYVDEEGMKVIDTLYSDYGELSDLCANGDRDDYCISNGKGGFTGVNLTHFINNSDGGNIPYLKNQFPKLDFVKETFIL